MAPEELQNSFEVAAQVNGDFGQLGFQVYSSPSDYGGEGSIWKSSDSLSKALMQRLRTLSMKLGEKPITPGDA
ncbi:hypothetical protein [Cyanobium sp. Copco_Reservoir_LC18]|uniref:hypothetical protein n=1 Tax=Cyanobium sp. Copco_Reservoir_LC18 TaxID=1328305 RepID=UPI0013581F00|nr:hypothetical protein [Cyanobium sp. Copco_Reservoir_LC18]